MSARRLAAARWGTCLALALGLHAAGAAALMARWQDNAEAIAGAPAILVDLSPIAVSPAAPVTGLPPGPSQPETVEQREPEPEKTVAAPQIPVEPSPAAGINMLPPPKPPEARERKVAPPRQASLPSAPAPSQRPAARAAAPSPGAARPDSKAVPAWQSSLMARLERHKRYPDEARRRREQGVAQLAFSVDRRGGVHNARIVRSSGSAALDRATLQLVHRAQPLPPPPPELPGGRIAIVVPIRYHIR